MPENFPHWPAEISALVSPPILHSVFHLRLVIAVINIALLLSLPSLSLHDALVIVPRTTALYRCLFHHHRRSCAPRYTVQSAAPAGKRSYKVCALCVHILCMYYWEEQREQREVHTGKRERKKEREEEKGVSTPGYTHWRHTYKEPWNGRTRREAAQENTRSYETRRVHSHICARMGHSSNKISEWFLPFMFP